MEFTCLELLPQSCDTMISNNNIKLHVLNILLFCVKNIKESINAFYNNKEFHLFDPHVGETSCQIRALILLEMANQAKKSTINFNERIIELNKISNQIEDQIQQLTFHPLIQKNKPTRIIEFLQKIGCLFIVNEYEILLAKSFFLTKYKHEVQVNDTRIEYNTVAKDANIPRKSAKKLARYYQLSLAKKSCDYILKWTNDSDYIAFNIIKQMLTYDDDKRPVLPCFYFTEIILEKIREKGHPILIVAERRNSNFIQTTKLLFQYSKKLQLYEAITDDLSAHLTTPCFVVTGETDYAHQPIEHHKAYLNRFIQLGLDNIILANMAMHPQYSGESLNHLKNSPFIQIKPNNEDILNAQNRLFYMKNIALTHGCCKENPGLLHIKHIYCDTLKRIIKSQKSTHENNQILQCA